MIRLLCITVALAFATPAVAQECAAANEALNDAREDVRRLHAARNDWIGRADVCREAADEECEREAEEIIRLLQDSITEVTAEVEALERRRNRACRERRGRRALG